MRTFETLIERREQPSSAALLDVSVVVVSFNTSAVLRRCLLTLEAGLGSLNAEIIVVDNNSRDDSPMMVEREFPGVYLIASQTNLGFGPANNLAFERARGAYVVLLNSDAFVSSGCLECAFELMEANPSVAAAGGRLTGSDGSWQPSARRFPSPLNDFLTLSGLAARFPQSKFFGRFDRTWADPCIETDTDWVPGAFTILRGSALNSIGFFDRAFFLYYEEVDLCRRLKAAGHKIRYWPQLVIEHLGGESSRTQPGLALSDSGAQLTLWRLRSQYIYYRKHHGFFGALLAMWLERAWYFVRACKAALRSRDRQQRFQHSKTMIELISKAWSETRGGKISPAQPW